MARRMTFEFRLPASPRFPVTRIRATRLIGRLRSSGKLLRGLAVGGGAEIGKHLAQPLAIRACPGYARLRPAHLGGRDHLHRPCDLGNVAHGADAPPDIAFARHRCVFLSLPYIAHGSRNTWPRWYSHSRYRWFPLSLQESGNSVGSARRDRRTSRREGRTALELLDRVLQAVVHFGRNVFLGSDGLHQVRVNRVHVLQQLRLKGANLGHWHIVRKAVDDRVNAHDLVFERLRAVLRLLQQFGEPLPTINLRLGGLIEVAGELREGGKFAELRQFRLDPARDFLHRSAFAPTTPRGRPKDRR